MMQYADTIRWATALPVYNEVKHLNQVLDEVLQYSPEVIVVNDGSTDGTDKLLEAYADRVHIITHNPNRGYGAALNSAFSWAVQEGLDAVVTIDCDGQHQPQRIRSFVEGLADADMVSGSRYLQEFESDTAAPEDRRRINRQLTAEIANRLGIHLTDAFCGFKAYRGPVLAKLELTENGYAMPLELWVQSASLGLKIVELPVPRIYTDEKRSFGGVLDDAATRLEYYHLTLDRSLARIAAAGWPLPCGSGIALPGSMQAEGCSAGLH